MIRRRPEAENTMRGPALRNQYWIDFSRYACPSCENLHDAAGRTLDSRGKIVPNPAVECPLVMNAPRIAPRIPPHDEASRRPRKKNRMLATEAERQAKLVQGLSPRKK
jgi:hypothetical protein